LALAKDGIRAKAVAPGHFELEPTRPVSPTSRTIGVSLTALHSSACAEPEHIAGAVALLHVGLAICNGSVVFSRDRSSKNPFVDRHLQTTEIEYRFPLTTVSFATVCISLRSKSVQTARSWKWIDGEGLFVNLRDASATGEIGRFCSEC
jgi:hypothetical protein